MKKSTTITLKVGCGVSEEKSKIEAIIGNKYDLKSQISVGGMGKIYLGIHRSLNKRVAIKIIHKEFRKDETFRKRFCREARLAANLDHPGIVDIYDFGSLDNFDYIIMPFVDGETLKERIDREKRLPISKSLNLISAITSALSFAHKNNVVHRDIKPSNILIDKQEHAYITDFGISKDLGDVGLTLPETMMGSPKYISPEQITGKKVDGRSDLYALGLVFYEMITGRYPYADRDANAIYYAHVNEVPARPDQVEPEIPGPVSDIIMKLLEKLPEYRYQKGSELLQHIANIKSGRTSVQFPESERTVTDDSSTHIVNDDDNDQPTVINAHRTDDKPLFDSQQFFIESTDSSAKSKLFTHSRWPLILTIAGLSFSIIIGYLFVFKSSTQTGRLPVQGSGSKSVPVAPSREILSIDERSTSNESVSVQPDVEKVGANTYSDTKLRAEEKARAEARAETVIEVQKKTEIKKAVSIPQKPLPEVSEKYSSLIASKQPAAEVNLISLTNRLKTLGENQVAEFIRLWTTKKVYKIGDSIDYHFQANQNCYLTVLLLTASDEIIQVFPNRYHPDQFVSAKKKYDIPTTDSDIELEVTGPPGIEEILAFASIQPFELLPFNAEAQPFFVVDETNSSLLKQIDENLYIAKKLNLKQKRIQYLIAK